MEVLAVLVPLFLLFYCLGRRRGLVVGRDRERRTIRQDYVTQATYDVMAMSRNRWQAIAEAASSDRVSKERNRYHRFLYYILAHPEEARSAAREALFGAEKVA